MRVIAEIERKSQELEVIIGIITLYYIRKSRCLHIDT